jgi:ATP adenylyltransferase
VKSTADLVMAECRVSYAGTMDIIWAAWRAAYVKGADVRDGAGCVFCALPEHDDGEALILERGERVYSVLNRFPYTTGHLMVMPYRHVAGMGDLDDDERTEVWELLDRGRAACERAMSPDAFNLGANLGRSAGAGIPDHFHLHLVPRWDGDTNFMTSVAGTRVMPEDLPSTWENLRSALDGA